MDIRYQVVVLDAADLAAVSSFWAGVLGGSVDAETDADEVFQVYADRRAIRSASAGTACSFV